MREIFWILKKDLTHCYRDTDVLIYALLFPLLVYPIALLLALETVLLFATPKNTVVALPLDSAQTARFASFVTYLKKSNNLEVRPVKDPKQALQDARTNAAITINNNDETQVSVVCKSTDAMLRLQALIYGTQFQARQDDLWALKLSEQNLLIFEVQEKNLHREYAGNTGETILLAFFFGSMYFYFVFGSMVPPSLVMSEELEKKTICTTMLSPVSRSKLVIAKLLAVMTIACTSVLAHLIGSGMLLILIIFFINVMRHTSGNGILSKILSSPLDILMLTVTSAAIAFLISTTYLATAMFARTVKSAQIILPVPMMYMTFVPMFALLPSVELTNVTCLVPLLGQVLVIKAIVLENLGMAPFAMAILEAVILSALQIWLVQWFCEREEYIFGSWHGFARELFK